MASPLQLQLKSLRGKVVMVTGASAGLGRQICLDLGRASCKVVAAARRVDRLEALCGEINRMADADAQQSGDHLGCRAVAVEIDISSDSKSIEAAINRAWAAFGTIDALVNNAGFRGGVSSVTNLSEEEWDRTLQTNLKGTWLVSKFVCRLLFNSKKKASIINLASIVGLTRGQWPGATAYAASKAGILSLTQMMALELGKHNIRVNSISPGLFKSEITKSLMEKDWINTIAKQVIPLGTFDILNPGLTSIVRFLVDDSSEYVSGNNFVVDGGHFLTNVLSPL